MTVADRKQTKIKSKIFHYSEQTEFYSQCYPWVQGHQEHPEVLGVHGLLGIRGLQQLQQHPAEGIREQEKRNSQIILYRH